jgi:hypothetical protein
MPAVDTTYPSNIRTLEDYTSTQAAEARKVKTELGRQEFLSLLAAQLRYQDPMEPQKDTQFIAQLASFNSLAQMESLNQTMTAFQQYSLVGKYVVAEYTGDDFMPREVGGVVERVFNNAGKTYAQIGDEIFEATKITDVFDYTESSAMNMEIMLSLLVQVQQSNAYLVKLLESMGVDVTTPVDPEDPGDVDDIGDGEVGDVDGEGDIGDGETGDVGDIEDSGNGGNVGDEIPADDTEPTE